MKWVVKVGGGLYDAPRLPAVLRRLHGFASPALLVPGGGPFADQVRAAQKRWGFDDCRAHAMALLGMRQYGLLLAALGGFETSEQLTPAIAAPRLWLPTQAAIAGHFTASWDVTSDSIAAWVAGRIGADWLVLIKPLPFVPSDKPLELVDTAFASTVKTQSGDLRCAVVGVEQWLGDDFSCVDHHFIV